jgi:hypothetical protein
MQLVTESDDEFVFFTEKTATPILLNKPFLVAGSVNFHDSLRRRGFELYTELFDYSFDSVEDINVRYEMIVENVKHISSMDLNELHNKVVDKLHYNKQHALKLINDIPIEITELLNRYPGQLNIT